MPEWVRPVLTVAALLVASCALLAAADVWGHRKVVWSVWQPKFVGCLLLAVWMVGAAAVAWRFIP